MEPLILHFPQWQGSGHTDGVRVGANTLRTAFAHPPIVSVSLSDAPLTVENGIFGYTALTQQYQTAVALLASHQPDQLLLLAGDCAAEVAPVAYLNERYGGALTVLWLDAHGDLNTPKSSPSGNFHGMPLRLLLDGRFAGTDFTLSTPLNPAQVILAGQRDLDPPEADFIAETSLSMVSVAGISDGTLLANIAQKQPQYLYIHLDLDVLEPTIFPTLKYPTPGGATPTDVATLITQLTKTYNVVGLSLTEATATHPDQLEPITPILNAYTAWLLAHSSPLAYS